MCVLERESVCVYVSESNRKDHDVDFDVICVLAENPNVCDPG